MAAGGPCRRGSLIRDPIDRALTEVLLHFHLDRPDAAVVRRKLQASRDDLLLLRGESASQTAVEIVPAASFVQATRSAVRLTRSGAAT